MNKKLNTILFAAMMTAMTCIATMIIKIPTIGTQGYVNIGDSIVLLSAWLLGNPYGALAAGIGSGLADLLAGYANYVPGTVAIKFAMAFIGYIVFTALNGLKVSKFVSYIISGVVAEIIMVVGYFLFEATFLGYGIAAAASIPSNILQGVTCLVLGFLLVSALDKVHITRLLKIEE